MKKRITVYFDEEQHRQARIRVAELDTNLSDYLSKLVEYEILEDLIPQLKSRPSKPSDSAG